MSLHDEIRDRTDRANTVVPAGFFIRHIAPGTARNATKRKGNAIVGSTSPRTTGIAPASNVIRTVALKGW